MVHIPRAHWYDNNVLWIGAQLVVFLTLNAIAALLLPPSGRPFWTEWLIGLTLYGGVTVGGFILLRRLRSRNDGDIR